jgi:hypothetical protein
MERDLKRARLAPDGLLLSFLVRIQTVDPSAFEMPDTPGKRSRGFFVSEGDLQKVQRERTLSEEAPVMKRKARAQINREM